MFRPRLSSFTTSARSWVDDVSCAQLVHEAHVSVPGAGGTPAVTASRCSSRRLGDVILEFRRQGWLAGRGCGRQRRFIHRRLRFPEGGLARPHANATRPRADVGVSARAATVVAVGRGPNAVVRRVFSLLRRRASAVSRRVRVRGCGCCGTRRAPCALGGRSSSARPVSLQGRGRGRCSRSVRPEPR